MTVVEDLSSRFGAAARRSFRKSAGEALWSRLALAVLLDQLLGFSLRVEDARDLLAVIEATWIYAATFALFFSYLLPPCACRTNSSCLAGDWEGPEALEARNTAPATISPAPVVKKASVEPEAAPVSEGGGSSDDASEDEYVAESAHPKTKVRLLTSFLYDPC